MAKNVQGLVTSAYNLTRKRGGETVGKAYHPGSLLMHPLVVQVIVNLIMPFVQAATTENLPMMLGSWIVILPI